LPGWQRFYEKHKDENFELISVAIDAQGAEVVKPWIEKANAAYPALVDQSKVLGDLFHMKVIPTGIFLDEAGVIQYKLVGGFNVENPAIIEQVEHLLKEKPARPIMLEEGANGHEELDQLEREILADPQNERLSLELAKTYSLARKFSEAERQYRKTLEINPASAAALFGLGVTLFHQDKPFEALDQWEKALALDPDNFLIRKQIWAVRHPDLFYEGEINTGWQKEQLVKEGYVRR